jgi:hypothetical protein
MTTQNVLNTDLSGVTGSGQFVGTNSPTLVTPTLTTITATTLAFSPTTGGIIGTTQSTTANAGNVGQIFTSQIVAGTPVSISSNTPTDLTSVTVTAGDWDIWGNLTFLSNSLTVTSMMAWTNLTSATAPDQSLIAMTQQNTPGGNNASCVVPLQRVNVSTSTPIYISGQATYITGSLTMCGEIFCRRRR